MGGDLNDIRALEEKQGGGVRTKASFWPFKQFLQGMVIAEIKVTGRLWTWANNHELEGFVEERLDHFCSSPDWLLNFPQALVTHEFKQSSDHFLLVLNTHPVQQRVKKRFYCDNRILTDEAMVAVITEDWNKQQTGHPMFQINAKIKDCHVALLKLKGT